MSGLTDDQFQTTDVTILKTALAATALVGRSFMACQASIVYTVPTECHYQLQTLASATEPKKRPAERKV